MTKVALIQLISTADLDENLSKIKTLLKEAVDKGAKFVALPENFALIGNVEEDKLTIAEQLGEGPIQNFLASQAKAFNIYLLAGTLPIKSPVKDRVYATSLLYSPDGNLQAHYHKIHLFDVQVGDEEAYVESNTITPGEEIVATKTDIGTVGLSVCYDLRFPELYRELLVRGAEILCVPSAFTYQTGKAHWETLLKARAIENLAYVIAPNQGGTHESGRHTYGHSMIISPWGEVLATCEEGDAVLVAEIDLAEQKKIRTRFPSVHHRRL